MMLRAVLGVGLLALTLSAQATPPPPPQQPTFRTGAELVRVDATVLDGNGNPVTTLTAGDFVIEEDGVRQKIQSFKLIDLAGGDGPAPEHVDGFEMGREDARMFLVFWDEYHIPPNVPARRLRDDLSRFLRTMLRPADVVAVMDVWTPMSHLKFTRDLDVLLGQVHALQGREGVLLPPRNAAEENHLREMGRIGFMREQVAVTALQSAMMHIATLREGRKTLLYFGREFSLGRDSFEATNDLIQTASDANVAVYSINPDGLTMRGVRTGLLSDLARNTGGESLLTNRAEVALTRASRQASAYYLIGYAPEPMRHDGKFHEIRVRVAGDGLQVRARKGYWAPTAGEMGNARAAATAAAVSAPPEIQAAFGQLARIGREGSGGLELDTILVPEEPGEGLRVDAPQVWRVTQPFELRQAMSATPPAPHLGRQFLRSDRLIVRFGVAGASAGAAKLSIALVGRGGKRLTELPFQPSGAGGLLDLPLSSIARGDYLLAFEARAGEARAVAYLPMRIE